MMTTPPPPHAADASVLAPRRIKRYGWKRDQPDQRDLAYAPSLSALALPPMVDLRTSGFNPPIWDQGDLGSCTAFGTARCHAFCQAKEHQKVFEPSHLFIYYWERYLEDGLDGITQDSGAYIRDGLKVLAKLGVPPESFWPYLPERFAQTPPAAATAEARQHQVLAYRRLMDGNLHTMKACLAEGFPFTFGFTVYESFESSAVAQSGRVPMPGNNEQAIGGHCFTGDTKVSLLNGTEHTLADLAKGSAGAFFWVYSCGKDGGLVPGLAHSARRTGIGRALVAVTLDNGEVVKCTPDHQFLCRDGSYRAAKDLTPGASLMPLYRKLSTAKNMPGYELVYNPATNSWCFTHRLVAAAVSPNGRYEGVVHHRRTAESGNKRNNTPDNLQVVSWEEHTALHFQDADRLRDMAKSPEGREQSRRLMQRLWDDPQWREKRRRINGQNGRRRFQRLRAEGRLGFQTWTSRQHSESARKGVQRRKARLGVTKLPVSPETIEKRRLTLQHRYETDPEFHAAMAALARQNLAEYSRKIRDGDLRITDRQRVARRANARTVNAARSPEKRHLAAMRTAYTRFHKEDFPSFEGFMAARGEPVTAQNHKVVSVEPCGFEDVYDITVETYHNFALTAGVFVHNCVAVTGYDDARQLVTFANSWGTGWGDQGYGYLPYAYIGNRDLATDFWTVRVVE